MVLWRGPIVAVVTSKMGGTWRHRSLFGHRTSGSKSSQFPKRICLTFCPAAVMTGPRPQLSCPAWKWIFGDQMGSFADVPNVAQ